MEIECLQSGNYKKEAEKNVKSPSREILVRFWNKSNGNWMVLESGQSRGAAKLALPTSWIDLRKVCQCKSSLKHTAGGIELSQGGLQCIFTMLAADEEKLPALEVFGFPTIIYDSRGTWLGRQVGRLFFWVRSRLLITLIKCLKCHKSLGLLFNIVA